MLRPPKPKCSNRFIDLYLTKDGKYKNVYLSTRELVDGIKKFKIALTNNKMK